MRTESCNGQPDIVQAWIDDYFRRYDPSGYATRIVSDTTTDGVRTVIITRWESCD